MDLTKIVDKDGINDLRNREGMNSTDEHVRGRDGDDLINGGGGNDVLEGNRGNDVLKGGNGSDVLFGGVGDDRLIGGNGPNDGETDVFAMRLTKGGYNTIINYEFGVDRMDFYINRAHFVLSNQKADGEGIFDLSEKRVGKLEDRLDKIVDVDYIDGQGKENGRAEKFLAKHGIDPSSIVGDTALEKADAFVAAAMEGAEVSVIGNNVFLSFLGGSDEGGTTIKFEAAVDQNPGLFSFLFPDSNEGPSVAPFMLGPNAEDDALLVDNSEANLIKILMGFITQDDDYIQSLAGSENLAALGGDDIIRWSTGNDSVDGGQGFDAMNYINAQPKLIATASNEGVITVIKDGQKDMLVNVEHLVGGRGDDEVDFSALEVANIFDGDSEALPHAFSLNQGEEFGLVFSDDNQGAGDEHIIGSKFKDYVDARHGDDVIYGGGGDDTLRVTTGNNQVYGGEGKDTISGGNHEDILKGGSGDDTITGGNYYAVYDNDLSDVHDRLWGEDGNDTLRGSGGKDRLDGGNDDDKLYGNGGDDELLGGYGTDMLNGGDGFDRASYVNSQSKLTIIANANGSVDVEENRNGVIDNDSLYSVEHIIGGRGDDVVDFSALNKAHVFDGLQSSNPHALNLTTGDEFGLIYSDDNQGAGNETITGSQFDDYVDTRWGNDEIYGGEGDDVLRSSGGNNAIFGDEGNDIINGGDHKDYLIGGDGDDYIVAGNYYAMYDGNSKDIHDKLGGGSGQDTLKGSGSNDFLRGGWDNDIIYGYGGNDIIHVGDLSSSYDSNSRQGDIIDGGSGYDEVSVLGEAVLIGIAESATMGGYYELSYTIGEHEYTDLIKDVEKVEIDGNSYVFGVDGYGLV